MKDLLFTGCGTAIITPFDETGINFEEFKKIIEFQISEGIDAIIVCGTTGEASTMTTQEKKAAIKFMVDTVSGRIPVIAGTGGNCTATSIEMSKYAESVGADGLLLVTPYYNKTTQEGLIKHFEAIAKSVSIPIILYSVPSRTGMNINPSTCLELSKIENIVAIKEASGNISQIAEISNLCGKSLSIYSGNDDQILPVLSVGGVGVISVLSNIIPKDVHNMIDYFIHGKTKEAITLQMNTLNLTAALFSEVNPIPIKEAMNMIGFNAGIPRLPLVPLSTAGKEKLKKAMTEYGIYHN
ncbi:MAG: 4-hydroxy-tetrahydrodipicolinate synthase [Oscillospiraceae bacterium]|nr:4-hydroxy-tetrahydrodipicolinate synthase [Oscillospiraceae bacterium]